MKIYQEDGKHSFFRTKEEKGEFIQKIKRIDTYDDVVKDKSLLKKVLDCHYMEFLLPYIISFKDINGFSNVEILGVGFFEDNKEILLK